MNHYDMEAQRSTQADTGFTPMDGESIASAAHGAGGQPAQRARQPAAGGIPAATSVPSHPRFAWLVIEVVALAVLATLAVAAVAELLIWSR